MRGIDLRHLTQARSPNSVGEEKENSRAIVAARVCPKRTTSPRPSPTRCGGGGDDEKHPANPVRTGIHHPA